MQINLPQQVCTVLPLNPGARLGNLANMHNVVSTESMHAHLVTSVLVVVAQSAMFSVFQTTASAGAKQPDAEYLGPDTADLFDLPRCNSNATGGLRNVQATVDPALVRLIEGMIPFLTQNNHSIHTSPLV